VRGFFIRGCWAEVANLEIIILCRGADVRIGQKILFAGFILLIVGLVSAKRETFCLGIVLMIFGGVLKQAASGWTGIEKPQTNTPCRPLRMPRTWATGPYRVVLINPGEKKINLIKSLRTIFSSGLKETADIVNTPNSVIVKDASEADAKYVKQSLLKQGAAAEIYASSDYNPDKWQPSVSQKLTLIQSQQTAQPPVVIAPPPQPAPVQVPKPTATSATCDVIITAVEDKSKEVEVEKVLVREFKMGLKDAYVAVYATPQAVAKGIARAEAERLKQELETAGASVELR